MSAGISPGAGNAIRLTGHWPELLADLSCLGEVWLESESPALTLSYRTSLAGLHVQDDLGLLQGEAMALRLLLGRCRVVTAVGGSVGDCSGADPLPRSLAIEDDRRRALLTLRLDPDADVAAFLLRLLLRVHGGVRRRIRPAPRPSAAAVGSLDAHPLAELEQRAHGLDDGLTLVDAAEVCGLLALHPRRLREQGSAVGIDPDLVPCALESLADSAAPMQVIAGNDAVVQRVGFTPFAARQGPGWQYLRGDRVTLRLDTRTVDSAWVVAPRTGGCRQVRLYDADGRAIAILSPWPRTDVEPDIWRTLFNALVE
jgi:putative heme degradation protein